jgi:hypothetical protein
VAMQTRQVALTLTVPLPTTTQEADSGVRVAVDGFGSDSPPGAPLLPTLNCDVRLPKGSVVQAVKIDRSESIRVPGRVRVQLAQPFSHDEPMPDAQRALARATSRRDWLHTRDRIRASEDPYPKDVVAIGEARETRTCALLPIIIRPVQYHHRSQTLTSLTQFRLLVTYSLRDDIAQSVKDVVLTTEVSSLVDPFRYTATVAQPSEAVYDYIVIVPDSTIGTAMSDFVAWKRSIGHNIVVEELTRILASYPGIDDPERVRNFLIQKREDWWIHYVLLVGDMGNMPTRLLYANDHSDAYASDFYFANLATVDWDIDGDRRWGEFAADRYDPANDVVVGRLPLNTAAEVQQYCANVIAFEGDRGTWKQRALFAAGFMDHVPTDGAELCERLRADVLAPAGWSARTLYEHGGTYPSKYPSHADLSQPNYAAACSSRRQSVVSLVAHGRWDLMSSKQCTDPNRNCDTNVTDNTFGEAADIPTNCPSAVVNMIGCSTACPVTSYTHVESQPGSPPVNPDRSLFPLVALHEHNGVRYLRNGAVAATGASAGTDYAHGWRSPSDGSSWTLAFQYHDLLIAHHKPVGDAFFEAMRQSRPLLRGVRDMYLMGDPSLIVEGIMPADPATRDVLVHSGRWTYFSATYDSNGDMFVAVSIGASAVPAELYIYKSEDHGATWTQWAHVEGLPPIISLEAIVSRSDGNGPRREELLVFSTNLAGELRCYAFPLAGGPPHFTDIPTATDIANVFSVAHDSLDPASRLYLAYWYRERSGQDNVVVGVSQDNGRTWQSWSRIPGYNHPTVDAGAADHVYVAAVAADYRENIGVARSLDGGRTWEPIKPLTSTDGAWRHAIHGPPSIAASSDPTTPAVWVAYERQHRPSVGEGRIELGAATSGDGGTTWQTNQSLATGPGATHHVHLAGHKARPNRWINSTYISCNRSNFVVNPATVMHRAASGDWPNRWHPAVIRNHVPASDISPCLVYSPGAPEASPGVVFAGSADIFFSAPWIKA